jgi:archaellum component FlaC
VKIGSSIDCKDLYDNAAEKLKGLDNDIDKTIQDLAKDIEARGVPKNEVGRQVVKELTTRGALSPSRIYEGLGIEQKRKHKKKDIEETFPCVENISTEESSANQQTVQVAAITTGQSETLDDFNGRSDIKSVHEEQKQIVELRQENERIREKEKESPELVKKLQSDIEAVKKQVADKTEEASELKREISALKREIEVLTEKTQPELFHEMQEKFYDEPGLIKGDELQRVNETAGKNLVRMLERYNSILNGAVVNGKPVPVGLYVVARPAMVFVPVRFTVDFRRQRVDISLWEKKLQKPSPSNSVSSDDSKVRY